MTAALLAAAAIAATGQGAHPLVHLNAALNLLATLLLTLGLWRIKHGRENAHGRTMLAALAVSAAFLVSYLTKRALGGDVRFTATGPVRYVYLTVLISHVLLALMVPFLAVTAAFFGSRALGWGRAVTLTPPERARFRARHIRLVRWAYPIWLYVSVTGVVVYLMLYHLWPSGEL
jgi:putative membrane protein